MLGRSLNVPADAEPVTVLRHYLPAVRTDIAGELAAKAVVLGVHGSTRTQATVRRGFADLVGASADDVGRDDLQAAGAKRCLEEAGAIPGGCLWTRPLSGSAVTAG